MRFASSPRIAFALAITTLLLLAALARPVHSADKPAPPNILLIISDDQGWTDYSFQKHPHVRTPHIDRLASEGLLFTRGYVPCSLCCPSLASMITGLYPHQHKITSNDPPLTKGLPSARSRNDPTFLALRREMVGFIDAVPTLPRLLGERGYLSFQTGKWWQGHFSHGGFTHGMSVGDPTKGGRHGDAGLDIGRKSLEPIYDFLATARQQQKPFFVWYAPMLPHEPHTPPQRLLEKYASVDPSPSVAAYWAMIEWFDETCGELLAYLDREKLADNTIVIYVTDNGWIQREGGKGYAARSKQSQYDGGLRTPIIVRWPGHVKPAKSEHLATSLDIAPTLLRAAGIEPPAPMVGLNLLDSSVVSSRSQIFGECFTHNAVDIHQPSTSLRWRWTIAGNLKLIVPNPTNERGAVVELYDLASDPFEQTNLAARPDEVARLRASLDRWWTP